MGEVRFRDGPRNVPDHVEVLLAGIPCDRLPYADAMRQANNRLMNEHLAKVQSKMIDEHFRRGGS